MPDGHIRLNVWLTFLPQHVNLKTAGVAVRFAQSERLVARSLGAAGSYVITEKGQQRRAELRALLENSGTVSTAEREVVHVLL